MAPVGPALPFVVGRAEAWTVFVCRVVLPARVRLLRSGCGRRRGVLVALYCWVLADLSALAQVGPAVLSRICSCCGCDQNRQLKRHLRGAAAVVKAWARAPQPRAPQQAKKRQRARSRGQIGSSQRNRLHGFKSATPPRRRAAPAKHAARQPRSAPRGRNTARRPPKNN